MTPFKVNVRYAERCDSGHNRAALYIGLLPSWGRRFKPYPLRQLIAHHHTWRQELATERRSSRNDDWIACPPPSRREHEVRLSQLREHHGYEGTHNSL